MPATSNASIRLELYSDDERERYVLRSRVEILAILRSLMQKGSAVTMYIGGSNDFLLSMILDVDAERGLIVFDLGALPAMNRRARRADQLHYVTYDGPIMVQFSSGPLAMTEVDGCDAFEVAIPGSVLRLQRREFYRISTPVARPVRCIITLDNGVQKSRTEVSLADISVGGMAILDHQNALRPENESILENCRLLLPLEGPIDCRLRVCDAFDIQLRNGQTARRTGCEFLDMNQAGAAKIQRYINRLDRERSSRVQGG